MTSILEKLNFLFNSIFGYYIITTNQRSMEEFAVHMIGAIITIAFMILFIMRRSDIFGMPNIFKNR